jgi:hypothetical protein
VHYDDPSVTVVEEDAPLLRDYYMTEDYRPERLAPWLLRLTLEKALLVDKRLSMSSIQAKIKEEYDVSMRGRWEGVGTLSGFLFVMRIFARVVCC